KQIQQIWNGSDIKRGPVEWSLQWLWNHPQITIVLSGMNDEKQINENIILATNSSANSMSVKDLEIISQTEITIRSLMKVGCTGCGYCMPCPSGVNIPQCFEYYNDHYIFDDKTNAKMFYMGFCGGLLADKPSYASLCEECGECEKKCPQGIPIIGLLKNVSNEFEGIRFKIILKIAKILFDFKRWQSIRK
ncbi:MAG: 4Fe-4S dicluster domain-containing protein, partial [Desulfotignum sp.]